MTIVDAAGATIETLRGRPTRATSRLSPDGRLVAFEEVDAETGTREIWVHDLERRSRIRLTQHAAEDISPMWSPDSRIVYFVSHAAHGGRRSSATSAPGRAARAAPVRLRRENRAVRGHARRSLAALRAARSARRLGHLDAVTRRRLAESRWCSRASNDQQPAVSPDGRFLAYSTPESGGQQVWVSPMPADGRRWRISSDYGREPAWSADGKTLYYHGLNRTLMRVERRPARADARLRHAAEPVHDSVSWVRHAIPLRRPAGRDSASSSMPPIETQARRRRPSSSTRRCPEVGRRLERVAVDASGWDSPALPLRQCAPFPRLQSSDADTSARPHRPSHHADRIRRLGHRRGVALRLGAAGRCGLDRGDQAGRQPRRELDRHGSRVRPRPFRGGRRARPRRYPVVASGRTSSRSAASCGARTAW